MKLLFLFTGGTIGSTTKGDTISTDSAKPYLLLEAYRKAYGLNIDYDAAEPYTSLSENNTGETLRLLCASVGEYLAKGGYDGIVVTHGTDTLQYSAAALSYAFADTKIPICLVSSNFPIEDKRANGIKNLHGAIRFITEVGTPGVFVPYKNRGEALRIHRGTRLLPSTAFSDRVESVCDSYMGTFRDGEPFRPHKGYKEAPDAIPAFGALDIPRYCREIIILEPYPGKCYPPLSERVRYVLHASYHSGTINTEATSTAEFFGEAHTRGITCFLTGAAPGAAYESTALFKELGIAPLYNISPIAAFVKLWFWHLTHPDTPATQEILLSPLAGDVLPG